MTSRRISMMVYAVLLAACSRPVSDSAPTAEKETPQETPAAASPEGVRGLPAAGPDGAMPETPIGVSSTVDDPKTDPTIPKELELEVFDVRLSKPMSYLGSDGVSRRTDHVIELRVSSKSAFPVRASDPSLLVGRIRVREYRYASDEVLVFTVFEPDTIADGDTVSFQWFSGGDGDGDARRIATLNLEAATDVER